MVTSEQLVEAYSRLKSVWKVAKEFGMHGQTVHKRLKKAGIKLERAKFSPEEIERIKQDYQRYADAGKLDEFAAELGRTKTGICRKAKELGFTDQHRPNLKISKWKYMTEAEAREILEKFKKSSMNMRQFCQKHGYGQVFFSQTMRKFFPDEWDAIIEAKAPKQTKYRVGREFEYRVRDYLANKGYFVMRSPRSRTPVDLVAIRPGEVLMIQCKRSGSLSPTDWNNLYDLACSVGAIPLVAAMPGIRGIVFKRLIGHKKAGNRQPPWVEHRFSEVEEDATTQTYSDGDDY